MRQYHCQMNRQIHASRSLPNEQTNACVEVTVYRIDKYIRQGHCQTNSQIHASRSLPNELIIHMRVASSKETNSFSFRQTNMVISVVASSDDSRAIVHSISRIKVVAIRRNAHVDVYIELLYIVELLLKTQEVQLNNLHRFIYSII